MANMSSLFAEAGIEAIIPYAFDQAGGGYAFLLQKLLEGTPLYVLISEETRSPYYFVLGDKIYFDIFTAEEPAQAQCDRNAASKFYAVPALVDPSGWARDLWVRYRDLGITHICLNGSIWISISDLAPPLPYDGYINVRAPLKNPSLNAALNLFVQLYSSDICPDTLMAHSYERLKESFLYVPVHLTRELKPGDPVTDNNSEFCFESFGEELLALLTFTDDIYKSIYCFDKGISPEALSVTFASSWTDIMTFCREHRCAVVINPYTTNLLLSLDAIDEMEVNLLNVKASIA